MTTTQQSEALRLADLLDADKPTILRVHAEEAGEELRRLHARVVELESQLEAIGAGGVESLRGAKPLTDEQIKMVDDSTHFHESSDWNLRFARAIEKHHGIGA